MAPPGEVVERLGLAEGVASGEGHTVEMVAAVPDLAHERQQGHFASTVRIVGLGIVATGAVVRASLREERKTESGPINDGLGNRSCNAHGEHGGTTQTKPTAGEVGMTENPSNEVLLSVCPLFPLRWFREALRGVSRGHGLRRPWHC